MFKKSLVTLVLAAMFVSPLQLEAATYKPSTNREIIAFLYGRIAQLTELKNMLENGGTLRTNNNDFQASYVSVETHRATEIESDSAVLRGEVVLVGDTTARAWFEYGQDEVFLDQKSRQDSVRSAYDRAVRAKVSGLEEDEKYYFRLVSMNEDDTVSYGEVYQFRTDEDY